MQIRTVAAITNGSLVLALYLAAWGAPSLTIAGLELALAAGAAAATWYALDLRRYCATFSAGVRRAMKSAGLPRRLRFGSV